MSCTGGMDAREYGLDYRRRVLGPLFFAHLYLAVAAMAVAFEIHAVFVSH